MLEIKNEFKTIQFALFFTDYDDKDTRVYRFLLPKCLISHSPNYQTKVMMHKKLETLYGAQLYARSERHANLNVMSFVYTIVDPVIVADQNLIKDSLQLLNDIFVDRSYFSEAIFEEEKRMLIEQWESVKDHKRTYANMEFSKLFFESDLSGYPMSGTLEDIKKTTLDDLIKYYQNHFFKQDIKIILNGHVGDQTKMIEEKLLISEKKQDLNIEFSFRELKPVQKKEEKTQMNQAILKLGYHFPIFRFDASYEAALCLDTIIGGYPESRLFREIREKQGLCYDISSNYDFYKGVLLISSGVAKHQKDYALNEIIKLVENIKTDFITKDELEHAKAFLIHQIKSSLDLQSYMTKRAYFHAIFQEGMTTEARINRINKVSLDDINQITDKLNLDTIYVLYGGQS